MPREVDHEADGPDALTDADIDPEYGDIAVCRCGLSPDRPFCDGSHRAVQDEDTDTVYRYPDGPDGERRVVAAVRTAPEASSSQDDPAGEGQAEDDEVSTSTPEGSGRRLVLREASGPLVLEPDDIDAAGGRVEICRCGLSDDWPYCDDSHAVCADEAPGRRYRYEDGERRVVTGIEFVDAGAAPDGDAGTDPE